MKGTKGWFLDWGSKDNKQKKYSKTNSNIVLLISIIALVAENMCYIKVCGNVIALTITVVFLAQVVCMPVLIYILQE